MHSHAILILGLSKTLLLLMHHCCLFNTLIVIAVGVWRWSLRFKYVLPGAQLVPGTLQMLHCPCHYLVCTLQQHPTIILQTMRHELISLRNHGSYLMMRFQLSNSVGWECLSDVLRDVL